MLTPKMIEEIDARMPSPRIIYDTVATLVTEKLPEVSMYDMGIFCAHYLLALDFLAQPTKNHVMEALKELYITHYLMNMEPSDGLQSEDGVSSEDDAVVGNPQEQQGTNPDDPRT